jgi:hypothetical protein
VGWMLGCTRRAMSQSSYNLMIEALRRYCMFHAGEPLDQAWIGLGTASEYKPALESGLMRWAHGKPSVRCLGWLTLTPKGQNIMLKWMAGGYHFANYNEIHPNYPQRN